MIAKWEKVGKSYKGFIFFPISRKNRKRCLNTQTGNRVQSRTTCDVTGYGVYHSDSDNDSDSEHEIENNYSWWNPISWIV